WCMVREGAFKLVVQKEGFKVSHLFDLENDPYEMDNLLDKPEHTEVQKRLFGVLQAWYERVSN
ncbi:MAG: DUF4976 domain-containing protein, partial [Candidatus Latescibacteria bacterium]|nr:DUF4976 domain-containing protein [Candidatus Latescibacterota bacterium]